MVAPGVARFPAMTLSVIVTVAPGPKSSEDGQTGLAGQLGGIATPPPRATTAARPGTKPEVVTPPVIVTPLIATVGSVGASARPMVSTGPPPWMTVLFAPAPIRSTPTLIAMPPANVPGPIVIVSP